MFAKANIIIERMLFAVLRHSPFEWHPVRLGRDGEPAMRRLAESKDGWEFREMTDAEREEYIAWWSIK